MKSYLRRASAFYTYSGLAVRLPIHLDRAHGHDPRFWPRRLAALPQPFNILKYTLTKKRGPCCNTKPAPVRKLRFAVAHFPASIVP